MSIILVSHILRPCHILAYIPEEPQDLNPTLCHNMVISPLTHKGNSPMLFLRKASSYQNYQIKSNGYNYPVWVDGVSRAAIGHSNRKASGLKADYTKSI